MSSVARFSTGRIWVVSASSLGAESNESPRLSAVEDADGSGTRYARADIQFQAAQVLRDEL